MGKMFRIYEQVTKKQNSLRPLHEFLEEQQEPFLLEDYLLDRQYSIRKYPNVNVSKESCKCLTKLRTKLLNPWGIRYNETDPNPWASCCCFLEMNLKPDKKRRRSSGGKDRNAHLDIFWHSEEYHTEEYHAEDVNMNVKRLKFTVQGRKAADRMQVESAEDLNKEHGLASIQKYEGSLGHYTRIFGFKKENKVYKDERNKKNCEEEKIVKCSLFKSILRKLTPNKESLPNILTDVPTVSKVSKGRRRLSHGKNKADHCDDDQIRLRDSEIVRSDSLGEIAPAQSDYSREGDKGCVSFEPPRLDTSCISAMDPDNSMKLNEGFYQEVKLGIEYNDRLQSIIKRSDPQSLELSSLSSSTVFYSSLDSDIGPTSIDKRSSDVGLEESMRVDIQYPEGIDYHILAASCSSGHLSLDSNDFEARDHRPEPRYVSNQSSESTILSENMVNCHKHFGSSNDDLQQDHMHPSPPLVKNSGFLEVSRDKKIHVNSLVCKRDDDLKSRQTSCSYEEDKDKKDDCTAADDHQGENSDVHIRSENMEYESVVLCCGHSKQLCQVPVLETLTPEGTPAYGQHIANIQNSLTLEEKASWKAPSESESRNYILQDQGNSDDLHMPDCNKISSHPFFKCQEEIDWDEGRVEEYIKKVLSSSGTISSLIEDVNYRELQCFAGYQSPYHANNLFPSQCLKRKQVPRQSRMFLLESVKEMLESPRRQYGIEFLTESFIEEIFGHEQLANAICNQICKWKKVDTNIAEKIVQMASKKEEEEWTKFQEETKEIGIEIEELVFGVLIEELVEDLTHFQL